MICIAKGLKEKNLEIRPGQMNEDFSLNFIDWGEI